MKRKNILAAALLLVIGGWVWAETPSVPLQRSEAAAFEQTVQEKGERPILAAEQAKDADKEVKPATKGPPLPVHTIEGYGGGAITPTAYLSNPGSGKDIFGLPSISATGVFMGNGKNLETIGVTETLFGRVELGYGFNRFGVGDLRDDIEKVTNVDIQREEVYLHNFNLRGLILPENSFKTTFVPAVTAGVHYKYNEGIDKINDRLGGALSTIGYHDNDGVDFTITASKSFQLFTRPLIVSAGVRNSEAAWLGYLGFGDDRHWTFEGNAIYVPTNWLAVSYEFRGKHDPYKQIPGLVGDEDNLQAISLIFMPTPHFDISLVYGIFGTVANSEANSSLALQLKWEF